MFKDHLDVVTYCKENQIEFIDFKLLDLADRKSVV